MSEVLLNQKCTEMAKRAATAGRFVVAAHVLRVASIITVVVAGLLPTPALLPAAYAAKPWVFWVSILSGAFLYFSFEMGRSYLQEAARVRRLLGKQATFCTSSANTVGRGLYAQAGEENGVAWTQANYKLKLLSEGTAEKSSEMTSEFAKELRTDFVKTSDLFATASIYGLAESALLPTAASLFDLPKTEDLDPEQCFGKLQQKVRMMKHFHLVEGPPDRKKRLALLNFRRLGAEKAGDKESVERIEKQITQLEGTRTLEERREDFGKAWEQICEGARKNLTPFMKEIAKSPERRYEAWTVVKGWIKEMQAFAKRMPMADAKRDAYTKWATDFEALEARKKEQPEAIVSFYQNLRIFRAEVQESEKHERNCRRLWTELEKQVKELELLHSRGLRIYGKDYSQKGQSLYRNFVSEYLNLKENLKGERDPVLALMSFSSKLVKMHKELREWLGDGLLWEDCIKRYRGLSAFQQEQMKKPFEKIEKQITDLTVPHERRHLFWSFRNDLRRLEGKPSSQANEETTESFFRPQPILHIATRLRKKTESELRKIDTVALRVFVIQKLIVGGALETLVLAILAIVSALYRDSLLSYVLPSLMGVSMVTRDLLTAYVKWVVEKRQDRRVRTALMLSPILHRRLPPVVQEAFGRIERAGGDLFLKGEALASRLILKGESALEPLPSLNPALFATYAAQERRKDELELQTYIRQSCDGFKRRQEKLERRNRWIAEVRAALKKGEAPTDLLNLKSIEADLLIKLAPTDEEKERAVEYHDFIQRLKIKAPGIEEKLVAGKDGKLEGSFVEYLKKIEEANRAQIAVCAVQKDPEGPFRIGAILEGGGGRGAIAQVAGRADKKAIDAALRTPFERRRDLLALLHDLFRRGARPDAGSIALAKASRCDAEVVRLLEAKART